jgi:pimeloyl-ACP methyl ester carboxylesterase
VTTTIIGRASHLPATTPARRPELWQPAAVPDGLHVRRGGTGSTLLLLLHGLGADADVWDPLLPHVEDRFRWAAVDLPGHGGSAPLPRYSFGALAAAVAPIAEPDEPVVALGHSLGGVIALALASGWFGLQVVGAVALGSKVVWTDDELARARALAERPVTVLATREEAVARALRVAGLTGLVGEAAAERLVVEVDGGWRLALDPAAFGVGAPDAAGLLAAARCPVVLARGATDPMVSADQLAALAPRPVDVPGAGTTPTSRTRRQWRPCSRRSCRRHLRASCRSRAARRPCRAAPGARRDATCWTESVRCANLLACQPPRSPSCRVVRAPSPVRWRSWATGGRCSSCARWRSARTGSPTSPGGRARRVTGSARGSTTSSPRACWSAARTARRRRAPTTT